MRKAELGKHKRHGQEERGTRLRHAPPRVPEGGQEEEPPTTKKPSQKLLGDEVWLVPTSCPPRHLIKQCSISAPKYM